MAAEPLERFVLVGHSADDRSAQFASDVAAGPTASPKYLRCRYFHDRLGTRLFEAICELREYYLTPPSATPVAHIFAAFRAGGRPVGSQTARPVLIPGVHGVFGRTCSMPLAIQAASSVCPDSFQLCQSCDIHRRRRPDFSQLLSNQNGVWLAAALGRRVHSLFRDEYNVGLGRDCHV